MIGAARPAAVVRPLDERSRHLVPDEPTMGPTPRDHEVPTTEPDVRSSALARIRDAVVDELAKRSGDGRTPSLRLISEGPTRPTTDTARTSDVFAPAGAKERVLDSEAATPRDRPLKNLIDEKPTDVGHARAAPTTATFHYAPRSAESVRRPMVHERVSRERESEREAALVKSVYDTEHGFHALKNVDSKRAEHIMSLRDKLKESEIFTGRDLVLAIHAREKRQLEHTTGAEYAERNDRVMALGLIARELDDKYRAQMRGLEKMLTQEFRRLDEQKKEAVYADLDTFAEDDRSNDSSYCRKELHRAVKDEAELHRAYIYALALEKLRRARESTESAALKRPVTGSSRSRK